MFRILGVALVLIGCGLAPAYAQCAVQPWSIPYLGSNTSTTMAAGSGQPCQIYPSVGGTNVMTGIAIVAPANNGTASASNDVIVYQSQPGFTGQDSFTFTITGNGPGGSGTSAVQVGVTVQ
ncbi:MAG: Ig-like domain-containing protein [Pseudorhodoplanes sp.]